jgi:hypothetical protein
MKLGQGSDGVIGREHGMLALVTCDAAGCRKQPCLGYAVRGGGGPLKKSGGRQDLAALLATSRRTLMRKPI